jgi:hypothetical protein
MSTVVLGAVFFNSAANPSDTMGFPEVIGLGFTKTQAGDVRALANGRLRMVTSSAKRQSYDLELELLTRTQIDWLVAHVGQLLCVRDDRGRKVFGTYFGVRVDEIVARADYGNASLQFTEVTYTEAV